MKIIRLNHVAILLLMIGFVFQGCQEKCQIIDTYSAYEPVYMSRLDLKAAVGTEDIRSLNDPGKIYKYNNYILINEKNKGVHVVNNANPTSPEQISFINIPGNTDMAVKSGFLYANSYVDLVVIDISNPASVSEVSRIEDIFPQRTYANSGIFQNPEGIITEYIQTEKTESRNVDCGKNSRNFGWGDDFMNRAESNDLTAPILNSSSGSSGSSRNDDISSGTGGSLARFSIVNDYLYFVDDENMSLFNISNPANPTKWTDINLGFGIETIFSYNGNLFIGSQTGMHIYDNSNPSNPEFISTYEHVTSCDPVVVEGQYAYVTLRSGSPCQTAINQLDVVDISNLSNPTLARSYPMHNPHGLGIDNSILFVCEAEAGLKVFNASDPFNIDINSLDRIRNVNAYDVIPQDNLLLLIGSDGFYQYDYTNPGNLQYLSKIPVN